jgi:hypothetical protein
VSSLDRWLERLNFSERARDAMRQASLDWRHERRAALSTSQVVRAHVLGAAGVARVAAHEATTSLGEALRVGELVSLIGTCAAIAVLLALPYVPLDSISRVVSFGPQRGDWDRIMQMPMTVVGSALGTVWVGLFAWAVTRSRRSPVPVAGIATVGIAAMTLLANGAWPWAVRTTLLALDSPMSNVATDVARNAYGPLSYWTHVSSIVIFTMLASAIARESQRSWLWLLYPVGIMLAFAGIVTPVATALGAYVSGARSWAPLTLSLWGALHWFYLVRRREQLREVAP